MSVSLDPGTQVKLRGQTDMLLVNRWDNKLKIVECIGLANDGSYYNVNIAHELLEPFKKPTTSVSYGTPGMY